MGLIDEAQQHRLTGHQCHVQKMMDGIEATEGAQDLSWDEFWEAVNSQAKAREISRALHKRYGDLGIIVPNDQTISRHRRGECQSCR